MNIVMVCGQSYEVQGATELPRPTDGDSIPVMEITPVQFEFVPTDTEVRLADANMPPFEIGVADSAPEPPMKRRFAEIAAAVRECDAEKWVTVSPLAGYNSVNRVISAVRKRVHNSGMKLESRWDRESRTLYLRRQVEAA